MLLLSFAAGQVFLARGLALPDEDLDDLAAADEPSPLLDGRSGYFFFTAARTLAFSAGVPLAETRDNALAP